MKSARLLGAVVALALAATVTACGGSDSSNGDPRANASHTTTPGVERRAATETPPIPTRKPAADAGGLCAEFTYDQVEQGLGERFEVAAPSSDPASDATACVLRRAAAPLPSVTLTRHAATITAENYRTDLVPDGAGEVASLGQAAYGLTVVATGEAGPRLEVGWLTADALYTLSFATSSATGDDVAAALQARLVELARVVAA